MCGVTAARLYRLGQIVMLVADVWRGVLQHAWDETDLVRRLHGDEGGGCTTQVMQTHVFPELGVDAGADDVVDTAPG